MGTPLETPPVGAPPIWDPLGDNPLWGTPHLGPPSGAPSFGAPPIWGPLSGLPHLGSPFGATLTPHPIGHSVEQGGHLMGCGQRGCPQSWRGGRGVEETSPLLKQLLAEKVTFHPFFWGVGRPGVMGLPASSRFGGCRSVRVFSSSRLAKV